MSTLANLKQALADHKDTVLKDLSALTVEKYGYPTLTAVYLDMDGFAEFNIVLDTPEGVAASTIRERSSNRIQDLIFRYQEMSDLEETLDEGFSS